MKLRLIWAGLAAGAGFGATFVYRRAVFEWLLVPGGDALSPFGGLPIVTAPQDMMGATFGLAARGGIIAAVPVLQLGLYTLLRPRLTSYWRRALVIILLSLNVCFLGGAAFAYYVMTPVGIGFLLGFTEGIAVPLITVGGYLGMLYAMMFWVGVIFELPLLMFLLSKLRIVSYRKLRRVRRFVPWTAIILGGIITPGFDPVPMMMVAVPIIALYEVGLFLAWLGRSDGEDYLLARKCGRGISAAYWWVYGLPGAVALALARLAGRAWRRVRYGKVGLWS